MTKARTPTGTDGVTDPLVTETYREIATERAPASVNEALLRQANAQAGGTYSRSLLWLRPMAWAATIGLCLAIVVEVSNVPQPSAVDFEQRSLEPESNADAPQQLETAFRDDKTSHETGGQRGGDASAKLQNYVPASTDRRREYQPGNQSDGRVKSVETGEQDAAIPVTSPAVPERQSETRDIATTQRETTVDVDAFHVTDAPILDEAADMARMREGPNQEDESSTVESTKVESAAVAGQAVNTDSMSLAAASSCDAETQSEPESWLECIEELVEAGRVAEADEERQALAEAFPNFDIP